MVRWAWRGAAVLFLAALSLASFRYIEDRDASMSWDECEYIAESAEVRREAQADFRLYPVRWYRALLAVSPKPPLFDAYLSIVFTAVGLQQPSTSIAVGLALFLAITVATIWIVANRFFGPLAASCAVVVYVVNPFAILGALRPTVETLQGVCILLSLASLANDDRGRPGRKGLVSGIFIGLALLSKASSPVFLAPAVLWSIAAAWRTSGNWRSPMKLTSGVVFTAVSVAGPWYLRNWNAALIYARNAPFWPKFVVGHLGVDFYLRLVIMSLTMGPASILVCRLLWPSVRAAVGGSTASPAAARGFLRILLLAGAGAFVFFLFPIHFEPKWLVPIVPAWSTAVGCVVGQSLHGTIAARTASILALALSAVVTLSTLTEDERFETDWTSIAALEPLKNPRAGEQALIGVVGNMPSLNDQKLEMFNALTQDPNARQIVLHDFWSRELLNFERFDYVVLVTKLNPKWIDSMPRFAEDYKVEEAAIRNNPKQFVSLGPFGEREFGEVFRIVRPSAAETMESQPRRPSPNP